MNGPVHDAYTMKRSGITIKQHKRGVPGLFIPFVLSIVLLGMANSLAKGLTQTQHLNVSDCVQVRKNIRNSVSRAQALATETDKKFKK